MALDPARPGRAERYAPAAEAEPPARRRPLAMVLTLLVMAAFAGGLWFAYREGRPAAANGAVPLIRADAAPMKVRPTDPGGLQIPDRNMLFYGERQPKVEHLLPPPEQPLPRPVAPVPAAPPAAKAVPAAPTPPTPAAQPVAAPAHPVPPQKPAVHPAAKATAKTGGVHVQLGALRSEAAAQREWQRIRHKNRDLLGKLSVSTERADLGARGIYYRLVGGPFSDAATAERLCGKLKQRSIGCLVVR